MLEEGAAIIDVGGESTRPGGERVEPDTEIKRVVPVIEAVKERFSATVSVDTSKASVAKAAMDVGADIVNDISGFRFDEEMAAVVAGSGAGVVLMHLEGSFESMHQKNDSTAICPKVIEGLRESLTKASEAGIDRNNVCLDVGIGFGKTVSQNLQLIKSLDEVSGCFPAIAILIGVSRKSFLGAITGVEEPKDRVAATSVANAFALCKGADVLSVHDVREAMDTIKIVEAIKEV